MRTVAGTVAMVAALVATTLSAASVSAADPSLIYDAIPTRLAPDHPGPAFEFTSTAEFGDDIRFTGTARTLDRVTVVMSTWDPKSRFPAWPDNGGAGWDHDITLNIYRVDTSNPVSQPGSLIASRTQTFRIPWRPEGDPTCPESWPGLHGWRAPNMLCYDGYAFKITFDLSGDDIAVPSRVMLTVAYNTTHYGSAPIGGIEGPYDRLGVAWVTSDAFVGTDVDPNALVVKSDSPFMYSPGDPGALGTLRTSTGWSGYMPAFRVTATNAISLAPGSRSFGDVKVGTSRTRTVTVANDGVSRRTISGVTFAGANPGQFSVDASACTIINAGGSCDLQVTFSPTSVGSKSAVLRVASDDPSSPASADVDGTGGQPAGALSPTAHDYGSRAVGSQSASTTYVLSNSGPVALAVNTVSLGGADAAHFSITDNDCPANVGAGGSCSVKVAFAPADASPAAKSATLVIATDDPITPNFQATLAGEAVIRTLAISPATQAYGSVDVGTSSAPMAFTVTNTGTTSTTVSGVSLTGANPGQFSVVSDACDGQTLAPAATCQVQVSFTPLATGARTASLSITSNASGSPTRADLSGTGSTPPPAPGTGTITIIQDSLPNSRQDFSFRGGLGEFQLDDDDTGTLPRGRTFANLAPGSYTAEQIQVPGWSVVAIRCDNGDPTDLWWHSAGIELKADKHVTCTFTNAWRKPDALISVTSKSRRFAGNNIFSPSVLPSQTRTIAADATARTYTFWVKAQNDSKAADRLRIAASSTLTGGATVSFRIGGTDRTAPITDGTFVTAPRNPGASTIVQVRVTVPAGTTPAGATVTFTIASDSQPTRLDVVQGTVAR